MNTTRSYQNNPHTGRKGPGELKITVAPYTFTLDEFSHQVTAFDSPLAMLVALHFTPVSH